MTKKVLQRVYLSAALYSLTILAIFCTSVTSKEDAWITLYMASLIALPILAVVICAFMYEDEMEKRYENRP